MKILKRIALGAGLALLIAGSATAQQAFGGAPLGVTQNQDNSLRADEMLSTQIPSIEVNLDFNVDDVLSNQGWNSAVAQTKPFNVGQIIKHNINFVEAAGSPIEQINGKEIYRLSIQTEGTPYGINLYYDDFYIPEGGTLYIVSAKTGDYLGRYTHQSHPQHGKFVTEPLATNEVILQYERPIGSEMPNIQIEGIGYIFRPIAMRGMSPRNDHFKGHEDSSNPDLTSKCQVNINCPEGENWFDQKAGTTAIIIRDGYSVGFCSGALVNNTAKDYKPYILTAAHCGHTANVDCSQWIFGFHYEKPHCGNGDIAYSNVNSKSMVGAKLRSFLNIEGYSDGMLLEINENIPDDYRVYYNGWDHSDAIPESGASIHHPAGDAQKISTFKGGVQIEQWTGGHGTNDDGDANAHFGFNFKVGATEGGSSGSPLYNNKGLIIGTLSGGIPTPCSQDALYGRLNFHWDKYKDQGKKFQMAEFLDPKDKGKTTLSGMWKSGMRPFRNIQTAAASLSEDGNSVELSWAPITENGGYQVSYVVSISRNGTFENVGETENDKLTVQITDQDRTQGALTYSVLARYKDGAYGYNTSPAYASVHIGQLNKKATPHKESRDGGVYLTWNMRNGQVISKVPFDLTANDLSLSYPKANGFYYGPKTTKRWCFLNAYRTARFASTGTSTYISQINFMAGQNMLGKEIELVIIQPVSGQKPYTQKVTVPSNAPTDKMMKIKLDKPFRIDPEALLLYGFSSDVKSNIVGLSIPTVKATNEDPEYAIDGSIYGFIHNDEVTSKANQFIMMNGNQIHSYDGYMAIQLVITDSALPLDTPITNPISKSYYPSRFPGVKGFIIRRNGQEIKTTTNAYTVYWDKDGKTSDEYEVEAIYQGQVAIDTPIAQRASYLYPAVFDNTLNLSDASVVSKVIINAIDGSEVARFNADALNGTIDVANLPAGQYIATIKGEGFTYQQKVVKK